MEIAANTLTSSFTTEGEEPDGKWFDGLKSPLGKWLKLSTIGIDGLITNLGKLVKSLPKLKDKIGSLLHYLTNFDKLFEKAVKKINDYKGAMISFAKKPGGWVVGALATVASLTGAAALNSIGVNPVNIVQAGLNFSEALWNFNFQYTDKQLMEPIELINGMYSNAGDFVGRSLAQLIVGGTLTPPQVQINVRGLALNWLINPEIRNDLLQNVSQFAYQGIAVASRL